MKRLALLVLAALAAAGAGIAAQALAAAPIQKPPADGLQRGRTLVPWVVPGFDGTPFSSLAVSRSGTLYFIDSQYGQIDELTARGPRILLSSLTGSSDANSSILGLAGLYVTANSLWFTANGEIYEATFTGRSIRPIGSASGATDLVVLDNEATIYYTTDRAVFEDTVFGGTREVAGGGAIGPGEWVNGSPATDLAAQPVGLAALSSSEFYFTTADNNLALVRDGALWEYRDHPVDFFNGKMASSPRGVYALCGWSMCHIVGSSYTPIFRIPTRITGTFVAPSAIAQAGNGDFYEAFTSQSARERVGILEMSPTGRLLRVLLIRNQ